MANKRRLTDEQISSLKDVIDHFYKEDTAVRERQIRVARQLKLFWENFQRAWYSEVAHDWRVWDVQNTMGENDDQAYYDKPVNIYRAYLESIIAALSVTVPAIKCYPDDADNPLDLATAKAGDKICQLVFRHNNSPLLWLHSLFVYCTEGMVAAYNYAHSDKAYGEYKSTQYEEIEEMHEYQVCPNCGMQLDDQIFNQQEDQFQPDDTNAILNDLNQNQNIQLCPQCQAMVDPTITQRPMTITRVVGTTSEPKTRQCVEAYGLLNVKVAQYARSQKETPYLYYSYETHFSTILEEFPDLRDDQEHFGNIIGGLGGGSTELYERWARLSPQYRGEYPINNTTCRKCWLRPSAFNVLEKERAEELKKLFPDGAKVVLINDEYASSCNESLDDHWTILYNPLADYISFDPIGLLLVTLQDITNDLISLILQTIEHGIPQTFADPSVLDINAYRQLEATPGSIIPTKNISSSRKVSDGFYEVKTATLSSEILPFANMVQELAQLVSGALPSLFGGSMQGGGETASEYSMSRAQALQRLQTSWKTLTFWWKEVWGKVIPQYIKTVQEDERDVQQRSDGSFINTVIRRSELEGKIGKVELEANENLPMTWNQQKDVVMQLLTSGIPELMAILGAPENLPVIRNAIGLTDFYIPGEDERNAEYDEINILVQSEPQQLPPDPMMMEQAMMTGQDPSMIPPQEAPSVEIDPILDNHQLRFEVDKTWLISETGRLAKIENPNGYRNVLLHAQMHNQQMQQQMMMEQMMAQQSGDGAAPPKKANPKDKPAPIQGEGDIGNATAIM